MQELSLFTIYSIYLYLYGIIYFILWAIIQNYYCLFGCSNCSSWSIGNSFRLAPRLFCHTYPFWELMFWHYKMVRACVFHVPDIESTISPRSPDLLENNIRNYDLGTRCVHVTGLFILLVGRGRIFMYMYWPMHKSTFTFLNLCVCVCVYGHVCIYVCIYIAMSSIQNHQAHSSFPSLSATSFFESEKPGSHL